MFEMGAYVFAASIALPRVLRESGPQACIVFFSLPCGPLGLLVKALSNIPYVISLRGGDVPGAESALDRMHRLLAPLRRKIMRDARKVVANSEGLRKLSERADPIPVTVIPNGVDTAAFGTLRRLPSEVYRFLFVGRLNTQKNVALLLSALAELRAGAALPFLLTIIGDGPLAGALHTQATALGLDDVVRWLPWQVRDAMPACYAAADCMVNPSLYEGMPNVVLEAMASGLPVLASRVAGNVDIVEDEVTGLLFESGDCASLATAMKRAMSDRAAAVAWGEVGRARASERFSWAAAAGAYLELIEWPDRRPKSRRA